MREITNNYCQVPSLSNDQFRICGVCWLCEHNSHEKLIINPSSKQNG